MLVCRPLAAALAVCLAPTAAQALPRFAARNAMECVQCHVNPTGGGARNEYGANVFARTFLPMTGGGRGDGGDSPATFSGALNDTVRLGADIRAAYLYIRPEQGRSPGVEPESIGSFFLMQADLYHVVRVHPRVRLALDVGAYSGFEAWSLIDLSPDSRSFEAALKVGRFLPPFGIREVEHQLYTRGGVGLGASDRDTGLELTTWIGPWTTHVALLNGALGDTPLDTTGGERRSFEKAVSGRTSLAGVLGGLRLQVGVSGYFSNNNVRANPMFDRAIPVGLSAEVEQGVRELRGGPFLSASAGRLTYLADAVWVRDEFTSGRLGEITGLATYQELSLVPTQGVELIATHEFMDRDTQVKADSVQRVGLVAELFPFPLVELRVMGRKTFGDPVLRADAHDLVLFLHTFL